MEQNRLVIMSFTVCVKVYCDDFPITQCCVKKLDEFDKFSQFSQCVPPPTNGEESMRSSCMILWQHSTVACNCPCTTVSGGESYSAPRKEIFVDLEP